MRTPRMLLCGAAAFTLLGGCAHEEVRSTAPSPARASVRANAQPTEVAAVATKPAVSEPPAPAPERPLVHLEGPTLEGLSLITAPGPKPLKGFEAWAEITGTGVPLYEKPDGNKVVGYTDLGHRLPAHAVEGHGCSHGDWYEVSGHAYLCTADGAKIEPADASPDPLDALTRKLIPRVERPNPYDYGKVIARPAVLLSRLPRADELAAVEANQTPEELIEQDLAGTYLYSLVDEVKDGDASFYRTLSGGYLRAADVKPFPRVPMHGEHLGRRFRLPLAFAFKKTALYCVDQEEPTPCGVADKHARFEAGEEVKRAGRSFVLVRDRFMVPRENVRIARAIPRPPGVSSSEKWVHIDLSEQTLVAYSGDTPVFATLVSTGKPGHDTVTGLFRVQRAFLTKPMIGKDDDGPYLVDQVPWTMYFYGNYALHGAYWHDVFGHTRSHGCVNIPPVDARWLFYWARPLPAGWTARVDFDGVHVYVTGHTPPPDAQTDAAKAS